jgi:hypothetical protein
MSQENVEKSGEHPARPGTRVDEVVVNLIAVVLLAWLLFLLVTLAAVVADWQLQDLAVKITLYPVAAILICVVLYPLVLLIAAVAGFVVPILSVMFPLPSRRRGAGTDSS